MSETKKTAADYRKDLKCLQDRIAALEARISDRLQNLCQRFPDAVIEVKLNAADSTMIKARAIGSVNYIGMIKTEDRLKYIEKIEKWIEDQNPVKQTEIKFE
jgi:hypothetical protein